MTDRETTATDAAQSATDEPIQLDLHAIVRARLRRKARWVPRCLVSRLARLIRQDELNTLLRDNYPRREQTSAAACSPIWTSPWTSPKVRRCPTPRNDASSSSPTTPGRPRRNGTHRHLHATLRRTSTLHRQRPADVHRTPHRRICTRQHPRRPKPQHHNIHRGRTGRRRPRTHIPRRAVLATEPRRQNDYRPAMAQELRHHGTTTPTRHRPGVLRGKRALILPHGTTTPTTGATLQFRDGTAAARSLPRPRTPLRDLVRSAVPWTSLQGQTPRQAADDIRNTVYSLAQQCTSLPGQ